MTINEMLVLNVTGGSGIRESRHLQTGPAITGRGEGSR